MADTPPSAPAVDPATAGPAAKLAGVDSSGPAVSEPEAGRVRRPLTARNYLWIIGAAVVVVLALHFLGPILTPFLIGAILAYLGTPLVDWALRKGVPRPVSTVLVILLFAVAIAALFLVLIPLIQAEVALAYRRLPDLVAQATTQVTPWLQQHFGIAPTLNFEALKAFVAENMEGARQLSMSLLSGVKTGGLIVVSLLVNLVLIPVVMFYMLRDWNMLGERVSTLVPRGWHAKVHAIATDIDRVLAEFLRGQLLVMLVLAVFYAIGLSIAGLDRAVAIGILTGLLVFIPYVGFGIGLVLGVVAALLQWTGWPGVRRRALRLCHRPAARRLCAGTLAGGRSHRTAPPRGDLRAARLRAALRLCRRAAGVARLRSATRRPAPRARGLPGFAGVSRHPLMLAMEQLTFELAPPEAPTFANFLPGRNVEVLHALTRVADRQGRETGLLLWGAPASGRTHLLRAVVGAAAPSRPALYVPADAPLPAELPGPEMLLAVDDLGSADGARQGALFTLYNRLRETGGHLVAAADAPPGRLRLREDVRTRLGWGLVYELVPLEDADKPAALVRYARERGFALADEVIDYLLTHGRRDLASLRSTLVALDRYSLASRRPITVPLLRQWLQRPLPDVPPGH